MVGLNVFCYQELGQPQFMARETLPDNYQLVISERCCIASTSNGGDQCCWAHNWAHTHTHPLPATVPFLFKNVVFIYCCKFPLFPCSIVSTPVTLRVPTHCTPKWLPSSTPRPLHFKFTDASPVLFYLIQPASRIWPSRSCHLPSWNRSLLPSLPWGHTWCSAFPEGAPCQSSLLNPPGIAPTSSYSSASVLLPLLYLSSLPKSNLSLGFQYHLNANDFILEL